MLSGTLHGHQVRGRGVANGLAKTRRRTSKGDRKLQCNRIDIGDVEVVRHVSSQYTFSSFGRSAE